MTRFLLEPLEKKWDWAANTHMFYLQGRKTAQKYQTPINPIQISERGFPYLHNVNYNNLNPITSTDFLPNMQIQNFNKINSITWL